MEIAVKIAAAITDQMLVGLEDAHEFIFHDTATQQTERMANPAEFIAYGKRLAAVECMLGHDVEVVVAVPDGLCTVSYALAQASGMRFLPLERGTPVHVIERHGAALSHATQPELATSWLAAPASVRYDAGDITWLSDRTATALRNRMRRLEGQARGLQRLIDERAPLDDILTQMAAMRSALNAVGLTLLAENLATCLGPSEQADAGEERLLAAKRAFQRLN
jgi:DNA-binding FrmR family transcriptional regulator/predicted Fe-Mo cluster-binding NifX family protein